VAARKNKRMSAQVAEDEDYQLHYEKVAGIDVAKESAAVCVRLPPGGRQGAPHVAPAGGAGDGPGDHGTGLGAEDARRPDDLDGEHQRLLADLGAT
jgi:hypothetical protein